MIVFRYLTREVLISTAAVSGILLMIIVSGRFIKYLGNAAAGKLDPDLLAQMLLFRLPGFLELILPLGLFLGILLSFGRLYLESEMVVLRACGFSQRRLVLYALGPALLVAVLVGLLSTWVSPLGARMIDRAYESQQGVSEFDTLLPGRFQPLPGGNRVSYTEGQGNSQGSLENLFISDSTGNGRPVVVLAEQGYRYDSDNRNRYLVLRNGVRYEGIPGQADYRRIDYGEYGVRLPASSETRDDDNPESYSTLRLLSDARPEAKAQLHWRLSLPVLALVVALIAVPMSRTNPRQGRFAKLIPSILLYLAYLTLLGAARTRVEDAQAPVALIWLVHGAFLLLAANLVFAEHFWERLFARLPSLPGRKRTG
ncbi:LPS export ABC transporter permease LptF [Marinobacterium nitratireducens]|uniref:Lipopolysaccharide export system permease protein LptF n=1 Tax=Marinobacterium nitratireducens TaxID=518897 RepID=A0A917ZP35_9GAMM|nr:LPS export ABC transporter permease LptF [Marinobacterium nitratireducens]GGO86190.1 LPS export ABC transporter permease LptF [Marinobacterium nitratireducens]